MSFLHSCTDGSCGSSRFFGPALGDAPAQHDEMDMDIDDHGNDGGGMEEVSGCFLERRGLGIKITTFRKRLIRTPLKDPSSSSPLR